MPLASRPEPRTPLAPDAHAPLFAVLSYLVGARISTDNIATELHHRHLIHMARLVHYRIATTFGEREADAARRVLSALGEETLDHLLRAPALCEALRAGTSPDDVWRLLDVARAVDECLRPDVWSAMGDFWLGIRPPLNVRVTAEAHGFRGPRLACGIPVDVSLPAAPAHPSSGVRLPRPLNAAEMQSALARLDQAVAFIGRVSPAGHLIVANLVRNIVLRADAGRPGECWAATSGLAIGRVVVINPHIGPLAMLGEALLHEATHCALDIVELEHPLLRHAQFMSHDARVPSPWSGNPLSAHALLHATVVWAVLLGYWTSAGEHTDDGELVRGRTQYIRDGFSRADPSMLLAPVADVLSERAPDVVALAWASVAARP